MSEKLTTEEIRQVCVEVFADGGAEFNRWLAERDVETRDNIVDYLANTRQLSLSVRDQMVACPANCSFNHKHTARMSGDPYYWSGDE